MNIPRLKSQESATFALFYIYLTLARRRLPSFYLDDDFDPPAEKELRKRLKGAISDEARSDLNRQLAITEEGVRVG